MIATLLMEWKARCDGLIKGDSLQTVVAAPIEALVSADGNSTANKVRGHRINLGAEVEAKEQGGRKRKAADDSSEDAPKKKTRKRSEYLSDFNNHFFANQDRSVEEKEGR